MESRPFVERDRPLLSAAWVMNHRPLLKRLANPRGLAAWVHWFLIDDRSIPECVDGGDRATVWSRLAQSFDQYDLQWQNLDKITNFLDGIMALERDTMDAAEFPEHILQTLLLMFALFCKCHIVEYPDAREVIAKAVSTTYEHFMDRELALRPDMRRRILSYPTSHPVLQETLCKDPTDEVSNHHDLPFCIDLTEEDANEDCIDLTEEPSIPTFSCNICDRTFKNRSKLLQHTNFHLGVKPHRCSICEKTFRKKKNLIDHENIHRNEHRFLCNLCPKKFKQKIRLQKHCNKMHRPNK